MQQLTAQDIDDAAVRATLPKRSPKAAGRDQPSLVQPRALVEGPADPEQAADHNNSALVDVDRPHQHISHVAFEPNGPLAAGQRAA